jgi:hypothetical protein
MLILQVTRGPHGTALRQAAIDRHLDFDTVEEPLRDVKFGGPSSGQMPDASDVPGSSFTDN